MEKERIAWIDLAKVIGIYFMIIGHRGLLDENTTHWIFSFHMPLFFVISGMLFRPMSFKETVRKTFKSLIVPFLIITTLYCLFYLILYVKNKIPFCQLIPFIVGAFVSPGKSFYCLHPLCITLWFLLALSIIRMVSCLFSKQGVLVGFTMFFLAFTVFLSVNDIILPFAIDSAMLAFPFFTAGYLLSPYLKKTIGQLTEIIVFIISTVLVVLLGSFNGVVDINHNLFGDNVLMCLASGISGTIMVLLFSRLIIKILYPTRTHNHSWFILIVEQLSNGLLLIVGFSFRLTSLYQGLFVKLFPSVNISNNLCGLIIGLFVLLTFYPLIIMCQKYFPAILGFRKR